MGAGRVGGRVGLLSGRRLKTGETFDLIIDGAAGGEERVPRMITHCQVVGTDLFRLEARFLFPSAFGGESGEQ